ncbi:hypothetical protein U1Q18_004866 [Sarracenia purpurea var. burkii]
MANVLHQADAIQPLLEAKFKELEGGFKAWLAKPVEAVAVAATIAAQGAVIGAFMDTPTNNVSSSFPTPPPNTAASLNPQACDLSNKSRDKERAGERNELKPCQAVRTAYDDGHLIVDASSRFSDLTMEDDEMVHEEITRDEGAQTGLWERSPVG